ncbi:MAG: hypothetical protein HY815_07150 [Candidatus Riflebacteria bacterium]|nr:hypothetical protein [Candidatus Riflebacteria bacterium]
MPEWGIPNGSRPASPVSPGSVPRNLDIDKLAELLASPEISVRVKAAQAAADSGDSSASRPVADRLRVEPDPQVKAALIVTLGRLASRDGLTIVRALAGDPDAGVRCRVLETLFKAQDETVFPLAIRMISDLNPQVKGISFQILRKLGKEGVLKIIGKMLQSEDLRWKVYAVSALGQVASEEGVAVLARCLRHELAEVRLQAKASLVNLSKHGDPAATAVLQQANLAAPAGSEAASASDPDPNSTMVHSSPVAPRPQAKRISTGGATVILPPPTASEPAPPSKGASLDGRIRPTKPVVAQAAYTPVGEDSLKIQVPPAAPPPEKRFSTAKYKALFGESMPRLQVPKLEEPPPADEATEEAAEGAEGAEAGSQIGGPPPQQFTSMPGGGRGPPTTTIHFHAEWGQGPPTTTIHFHARWGQGAPHHNNSLLCRVGAGGAIFRCGARTPSCARPSGASSRPAPAWEPPVAPPRGRPWLHGPFPWPR